MIPLVFSIVRSFLIYAEVAYFDIKKIIKHKVIQRMLVRSTRLKGEYNGNYRVYCGVYSWFFVFSEFGRC